jgi:flavin reductase (DIM6/NTAB) family NADH-FMN oxidoreductase RutF
VEQQDSLPELLDSELKQAELKNSVRQLMRNVPSSVAIITVFHTDPHTGNCVPMGVAVSSLSTVTLDPPTISFNVKEPSQTLDAIRAANGLFRVHIPSADRGGAKLVDLFCHGNHTDAYDKRTRMLKIHQPRDTRDPGTPLSRAPQIMTDSVLAAMECEVTHQFPVADHVIIVAKINDIEQKISRESAILYIDRGYRNPNGQMIYSHERFQVPGASEGVSPFWKYPLFPGEKERQKYMNDIKNLIKADPALYKKPTRDTYRSIDNSLPYPATALGISIELLVAECRKEMGLPDGLKSGLQSQQVLSDFYGVLTPSMRQQIVDRAKELIKLDSRFLSQSYRFLLYNLGVSPSSRDFLPSDIMKPLRAASLAPPFDPQSQPVDSTTEDIRKVEQIERRLRDHLRKMTYMAALREPFEDSMTAIGENKMAASYFKKSRARLLLETHPTLFDASAVDIAGEVTQEEIRVIICRVINRLDISSEVYFRKRIFIEWYETLRRVRVNPTITGMDPEFLFGKIKYLYYSTKNFRDFPRAIERMLEPWFTWNVGWDDLEGRVKRFVQKNPLRATAWSRKDRLAAMGLHWEATVSLPKQSSTDEEASQSLSEGQILDTLVAKELKRHYGNGTEEENAGIAKYLKEMYNFDVTHKPIEYIPGASTAQSSADEMQQAMRADLTPVQEQVWLEPPKPKRPFSINREKTMQNFKRQSPQNRWKTYSFDR